MAATSLQTQLASLDAQLRSFKEIAGPEAHETLVSILALRLERERAELLRGKRRQRWRLRLAA